jgi:hypothetical protein
MCRIAAMRPRRELFWGRSTEGGCTRLSVCCSTRGAHREALTLRRQDLDFDNLRACNGFIDVPM